MVIIKIDYNIAANKYEDDYTIYLDGIMKKEEYQEFLEICSNMMSVLPNERIKQRRFSIINILCQSFFIVTIMGTIIGLFLSKLVSLTVFLIFFLGSPVTISMTMTFFAIIRYFLS
jgi:pilus assembly protein TadC